MEWLNYHHLLYFWTVAHEGSIVGAAKKLRLAQPTISAQIRALEESLGEKLFSRRGRGLELTDFGRLVLGYADEIFLLGRELLLAVKDQGLVRGGRLVVGVTDATPKIVAREVLRPALHMDPPVHVVVREGKLESLVAELAVHRLDLVLSDHAYRSPSAIKIFHHRLGHCGVSFLAPPAMARKLKGNFPDSLEGVPALLPADNTALRGSLEDWFQKVGVRPRVLAEFEDMALLKTFGSQEEAVFPLPSVSVEEVARSLGVKVVGATNECREEFLAITAERRLTHPAVLTITEKARQGLFL
jgi:LysR family transcriptional activator of nhaA